MGELEPIAKFFPPHIKMELAEMKYPLEPLEPYDNGGC